MKLIQSFGPNPRVVRMFLLEKGVEVASEEVDILDGETHRTPYLDRNPTGLSPSLELDDGTILGETVAICELIEDFHPKPVILGADPIARARSRMWYRRVELLITEHMYNAFRYGHAYELFRDRTYCIPEAAEGLKEKARVGRHWLDSLMHNHEFITGDTLNLADIILYCCWDFTKDLGQPIETELKNLYPWYQRMSERPSAQASVHPASEKIGMVG